MYKLIIGNVRVTVHDDATPRPAAISAAQDAVQKAARSGKQLSQIDVYQTEDGIRVKTTEKVGVRSNRKTLKQSMYDSVLAAAKENLKTGDSWLDEDSGQQWHGAEVDSVRNQILAELSAWLKQH